MEGCNGIALLMGTLLFLSACAPFSRTSTSVSSSAPAVRAVEPAPLPDQSKAADAQRLERLLAYAARSRSFTSDRLAAEYAAVRAAERRQASPEGRVRLAILLAHPRAPFRDDTRARKLLRQAARERSAIGDLARLLHREADQRAGLERALVRERARRAELQQKLEQLKTIEQEIDRRAPTPVVPERQ